MNCRRGEVTGVGILYIVFFSMFVVILVVGIVGGLVAFFGKGYDYREGEARALLKSVRECFEREKLDLSNLNEDIFFQKCGISKSVIEDGKHIVYVKDKNNKEFVVGVADFKMRCGLYARFKNREMPLCASHPIDSEGYEFLVGSSQNVKRVAV
ncbi:hypothetical protein J4423_05085 [Candidatus Pacearchaeota archaeon]|nr:hypothetical protein [Candidatus Pacearchaeota archaeon]